MTPMAWEDRRDDEVLRLGVVVCWLGVVVVVQEALVPVVLLLVPGLAVVGAVDVVDLPVEVAGGRFASTFARAFWALHARLLVEPTRRAGGTHTFAGLRRAALAQLFQILYCTDPRGSVAATS
jgi:hypothetical protein